MEAVEKGGGLYPVDDMTRHSVDIGDRIHAPGGRLTDRTQRNALGSSCFMPISVFCVSRPGSDFGFQRVWVEGWFVFVRA